MARRSTTVGSTTAGSRRTGSRKAASRKTQSGRRSTRTQRGRKQPRRWGRRLLLIFVPLTAAILFWLLLPFWQLSGQFGSHPIKQPSRLYGAPLELRLGGAWTAESLTAVLEARRYSRTSDLVPGTFAQRGDDFIIYRRNFLTANGEVGNDRLALRLSGSRVQEMELDGRSVGAAWLDPPLIAAYYGSDLRERRPITSLDTELAEDLILSVLAIEDSTFLSHPGLSLTGVLRAAWNNLRQQDLTQGGSTLTQQLVKNVYLTHERSFGRKIREAILAVLLEIRFDKRQIFRAYLNEIYWGRSGNVNLMGIGAASWAYFGKEPAHLSLAESALLAGIIQSPSRYSPHRSPDRAKQRRDTVLKRLADLRWVTPERIEAAKAEPIRVIESPIAARGAPYFADAMSTEARRRFNVETLRDGGYTLLSTLRLRDQKAAEEAVEEGLVALGESYEKDRGEGLQAALISVNPDNGAILAYVGGRNYGKSQFDRVSLARRQPGSAFKPVVFAAALAERAATPATVLVDEPYTVRFDGRSWSPKNSDGKYRGPVSARRTLELSLNVPTARLAQRVGLGPVVDLAHSMGIESRMRPLPALALGSTEVTPYELASVYATLATGGLRPTLHGLEGVIDRTGQEVPGEALDQPERVLDPEVAFLVTDMLRGVLDRGTADGARKRGLRDPLAGKTGTTNSRRDSWFAGYSTRRATLVWVGYDDNATTRLSGARAALPIWTSFVLQTRPPGGDPPFETPAGLVSAWIDPLTGGLATNRCPNTVQETFLAGFPPGEVCQEHARGVPYRQPEGVDVPKKNNPFRRWLDRVRQRDPGGGS